MQSRSLAPRVAAERWWKCQKNRSEKKKSEKNMQNVI